MKQTNAHALNGKLGAMISVPSLALLLVLAASCETSDGWRPAGTLPGAVQRVAYDPEEPKRVYAATGTELFRSSDGGENWDPVPTAVSNIRALAVDSSGTVYVAASEGALLRSVDRGESWERVGA